HDVAGHTRQQRDESVAVRLLEPTLPQVGLLSRVPRAHPVVRFAEKLHVVVPADAAHAPDDEVLEVVGRAYELAQVDPTNNVVTRAISLECLRERAEEMRFPGSEVSQDDLLEDAAARGQLVDPGLEAQKIDRRLVANREVAQAFDRHVDAVE